MTQKIMEWIAEADQKRTECADSEMEYWRGVRDGLQRVLNAIPEPTEDDCDCDERSWYGSLHDSDCPLAGKPRQIGRASCRERVYVLV